MDPNRFATSSLRDPRLLRVLSSALAAVEPETIVRNFLVSHPLPRARRVYGLAVGKAAPAMMSGLAGSVHLEDGLVITKPAPPGTAASFRLLEGGHPVPDVRSVAAGQAALDFVRRLGKDDLLLCLISGGGSALMTAPLIPLEELQNLTSSLLRSGARIDEINTLRRHIDRVKGGGLARAAGEARVLSLILSDVVGSPLEAIASGPTAADPTSIADVKEMIAKYDLGRAIDASVLRGLTETLKPGDPLFSRVENHVIGSIETAARAALGQAAREGFDVGLLTTALQGEARQLGRQLAARLRAGAERAAGPFCLVAGGETTVTVRGDGRGGRNQELALAAMQPLSGLPDAVLISLATDGEDGMTGAAGAVVTGASLARAESLGLDIAAALGNNDSYAIFEALGDLLNTGPTGTNVNDLVLMARL
jgi:hydroxypyruvate reductase